MTQRLFATFDPIAGGAGYTLVDPPILQPAKLFFDLLGEDIRRRAFVTTNAEGEELCLRPDFTIPVSLHHLRMANGTLGSYAYRGPIFRMRAGETGEFMQGGFESFGRTDTEAADADMLARAVETVAAFGVPAPEIRLGDAGLVSAFLNTLKFAPVWRRRLEHDLRHSTSLDDDLAKLAMVESGSGARRYAGFLAALEGSDPAAARAIVTDLLSIAGISPVGGRGVDEIADRFLEQAAIAGSAPTTERVQLMRAFFAIQGDPDSASAALRALASEAGLDLGAALDAFDSRTGFMAAQALDPSAMQFSTNFARRLDYYTGFVFELHDPARPTVPHLAGGGRYDRLLTQLGSPTPVPAVGCSVWFDRLPSGTP